MIRKIINWFLSLFNKSSIDSLEGFVPKSSVKRGSDIKPDINRKPFLPRVSRVCPVCDEPMFISLGQISLCHRSCRKKYRRSLRDKYAN